MFPQGKLNSKSSVLNRELLNEYGKKGDCELTASPFIVRNDEKESRTKSN
jgi:hypothetical protein